MFMSSLHNALLFTVYTLFNAYIIIVLFRFMLQLVRAGFSSPLAHFAQKVTNPVLTPLRKIIPSRGNFDFAALILALALQALELYLVLLINGFNVSPTTSSISGLCLWSIGELIDLTLVFLFFSILIQVIFSWIQPGQYNPNIMLLTRLTDPLFGPVRRILPTIGMIDFSPLVVIFLISLSRMLIADPLVAFGKSLI